jgi:hypothetical protein
LLTGALSGLVAADALGFHGALFHSDWWRGALWVVALIGFVVGAGAQLRPPQ